MSRLALRDDRGARFRLDVTQFRSTMSASVNSVQTKTMMHHFPIRCGQPDIEFTVQFRSIDAQHEFQAFVRDHQRNTQKSQTKGMVTLFWPERNIDNWTGYIVSMPVRESRFEYAPKVTFGVMLIASLMSTLTTGSSRGASFWNIAGPQIPSIDDLAAGFRLPTPPASL